MEGEDVALPGPNFATFASFAAIANMLEPQTPSTGQRPVMYTPACPDSSAAQGVPSVTPISAAREAPVAPNTHGTTAAIQRSSAAGPPAPTSVQELLDAAVKVRPRPAHDANPVPVVDPGCTPNSHCGLSLLSATG